MADFKQKPEQAQWLTPYLIVKDIDACLDFYQNALGLTLGTCVKGPDGAAMHAELQHKDKVVLMCAPEGAFGATSKSPASAGYEVSMTHYLYVDDVDAAFRKAKAAGATPDSEPEDMFWGDRAFRISDPSGYAWMIASHIGEENAPPPPEMG